MARQIPTQEQLQAVFDNDFETFVLPADSSLDLGTRTVYGTTDPALDLSVVNVAHLNTTRHFRGVWDSNPLDLQQPVPYEVGQVVVGSDNHLYILQTGGDGAVNPVTDTNAVNWMQLSTGLDEAVTELTVDPESAVANLFRADAETLTFTVSPSSNAVLLEPSVSSVDTDVVGSSNASVTDAGVVSVVIPRAQTNANATITATVESRSTSNNGEDLHEGGQIDIPITFVDARIAPTIDGEGTRVSNQGPNTATFNIDLTPGTANVADGTAYESQWRVNGGASSTALTYTTPPVLQTTDFTFDFPLNLSSNGQVGTPPSIVRNVRVYTPWYWQIANTVPSTIAGATEGILVGDTQGDNFPTNNTSRFSLVATPGETINFYMFVPVSITGSITLNVGIAHMQSLRLPDANNISVPNNSGGNTVYAVHQFTLGLPQSPTVFTILTA